MSITAEKMIREPVSSSPDSDRRKLWANAAPALILMCIVLLPSVLLPLFRQRTFLRYKGVVTAALQNGDYDTANLFADKMLHLAPPDDVEAQYHWATIETLRGNIPTAKAILQRLAPENSSGFGAAHLWLARDLLQSGEELKPQDSERIMHHLNAALKSDPEQTEAQFLLGRCQQRTGRHLAATESLQKIVLHYPSVHFLLADSYEHLHDSGNAGLHWEAAAHHFRQARDAQPEVVDHWLKLCQSYFRQQRFEEAEQIIKDGVLHFRKRSERSSGIILSQAFSALCAAQFQQENSADPQPPGRWIDFLAKAVDYDAGNVAAISAVANVWNLTDAETDQMEENIANVPGGGHPSGVSYVMVGILGLKRGDSETAERQFRAAETEDPGTLVVMHNVAKHMMNSATPALESAVQLCDAAILLAKSGSSILRQLSATRGQLHMELRHWEFAFEDLNVALIGQKNQPDVHRLMAKVCQQLGKPKEAEIHQRAANSGISSESP
jgi:tetratricopeptide (TPR) repeat protein